MRTCRVAACLPVYAMSNEMAVPIWTDFQDDHNDEIADLLKCEPGKLKYNPIAEHTVQAWKDKDEDALIYYTKLFTMMSDVENRKVTNKGVEFVKKFCDMRCAVKAPHVFLALLLQTTVDPEMRRYIHICLRMAAIPTAPHRLIMYTVIAKCVFGEEAVVNPGEAPLDELFLDGGDTLKVIPDYAVDKHTFRGRTGKSTMDCLDTSKIEGLDEERLDNFHGQREKRDIEYFFEEGTKTRYTSLDHKPFWEETKNTYRQHDQKHQKTSHMTTLYYQKITKRCPYLFEQVRDDILL